MENTILATPYRRYLARAIDDCIYMLVAALIVTRGFRFYFWHLPLMAQWYLMIAVMLTLEPLCLSLVGWTPGKWILGLRLRDQEGKLSYSKAWKRTTLLIWKGMGLGIVGYELYRNFKSWVSCKYGDPLEWDIEDSYQIVDRKKWRFAASGGIIGLSILGMILIYDWGIVPKHTGKITVEEFTENLKDLMHYMGETPGYILNPDAAWEKDPNVGYQESDLGNLPEFQFQEEGGYITRLIIVQETEGVSVSAYKSLVKLGVMAYLGAEDSAAAFKPSYWDLIEKFEEDHLDSFQTTYEGKNITCEWEIENGIYGASSDTLIQDDQEKPIKYRMRLECS